MTRATLLHVLDHTTAIAPAEVRELEQLAQAFPYCQTAHLLLAKAAHDHGTMLAGQRLRRAATYATDRELLRRLIEQVAPAHVLPEPGVATPEASSSSAEPAAIVLPPEPAEALSAASLIPAEPAASESIAVPIAAPEPPVALAAVAAPETTPPAAAEPSPPLPAETVAAPPASNLPPLATAVAPTPAAEEASAPPAPETSQAAPSTLAEPLALELPLSEATADLLAAALREEAPTEAGAPIENVVEATPNEAPVLLAEAGTLALPEPEIAAAAPPIRPPADAGEARFEFGLVEEPAPIVPVYELPGLVDEWASAAATQALAPTKPQANAILPGVYQAPVLSPAAFTGDASLGYGLDEGSRLGFAMQVLNSWEADDQAAAGPTGPAAPLPPTGEFFAPDALLLDHWATNHPAEPELPSPLDLINTFLRRQPRLSRQAMLPPTNTGTQADLSVRSTRAETDLASEGLAQILVRQGKTARAIEIYERLMVKQPEKMAYFAAQIQQLQPSA